MAKRTPLGQQRCQYSRDWGNYASGQALPNTPGDTTPLNILANLEEGDMAAVEGQQGQWVCMSPGTPGSFDAIWRNAQVSLWWERIDRVSLDSAQQGFFLPWGSYVLAESKCAQVLLNGTLLTFGVDWNFMTRQMNPTGGGGRSWPQPSTADVSVGIWTTNPVNAGDTITIRWLTGSVNIPAPAPLVVYAPGSALPGSPGPGGQVYWRYNNPTFPQSFVAADRPGLQIELWRMSRHNGRARGPTSVPNFAQYRSGRVFTPYYRFPVAANAGEVVLSIISSGGPGLLQNLTKGRYRLCYYDPNTGARSPMSSETILFARRDDRIQNVGVAHPYSSVWSGPS